MTHIILELCSGGKIVVFPHSIAWMAPRHLGGTLVWFGGQNEDYIAVKESLEQTIALIAAATPSNPTI